MADSVSHASRAPEADWDDWAAKLPEHIRLKIALMAHPIHPCKSLIYHYAWVWDDPFRLTFRPSCRYEVAAPLRPSIIDRFFNIGDEWHMRDNPSRYKHWQLCEPLLSDEYDNGILRRWDEDSSWVVED